MRLHAIAAALVGASVLPTIISACGESLPATEDAPDGAVDAPVIGASDGGGADVALDVDGGCTTAPCNVEEVAKALPIALAASTSAMVWLESATVFLLDPGKTPITLMTPPNGAMGWLAISNATVLMTEATGVRRCLTTGGCNAADPGVPIYGLSNAGPIVAGGGEMFVAERAGQTRLVTCGLATSCDTSPDVVAKLPGVATKLALTQSHVVVGLGDQTIRAYLRSSRVEAGAPAPAPLTSVIDLRGLAADGSNAYWADGVTGKISGCAIDACASTTVDLATNRAFPRALAAFDGKLYWVETYADAVVRCTLPACADATVIARVTRPDDLTVGDRVYVASEMTQRIYATAR